MVRAALLLGLLLASCASAPTGDVVSDDAATFETGDSAMPPGLDAGVADGG